MGELIESEKRAPGLDSPHAAHQKTKKCEQLARSVLTEINGAGEYTARCRFTRAFAPRSVAIVQ